MQSHYNYYKMLRVTACCKSLHVTRVLRCHSVNDNTLQAVYQSAVLAKLLYTSSAGWGITIVIASKPLSVTECSQSVAGTQASSSAARGGLITH